MIAEKVKIAPQRRRPLRGVSPPGKVGEASILSVTMAEAKAGTGENNRDAKIIGVSAFATDPMVVDTDDSRTLECFRLSEPLEVIV